MKAPSTNYKLSSPDDGKTWLITRIADGEIVKTVTGSRMADVKAYKIARLVEASRGLGLLPGSRPLTSFNDR